MNDAEAILNDDFTRYMVERGLITRQPNYRYFEHEQVMFCWTTQRLHDPGHPNHGMFVAFIYKPYGKGSRSGKAENWKLTKQVRFAQRQRAKARALAWYRTAKAKSGISTT